MGEQLSIFSIEQSLFALRVIEDPIIGQCVGFCRFLEQLPKFVERRGAPGFLVKQVDTYGPFRLIIGRGIEAGLPPADREIPSAERAACLSRAARFACDGR